MKAEQRHSTSV